MAIRSSDTVSLYNSNSTYIKIQFLLMEGETLSDTCSPLYKKWFNFDPIINK